MRVWKTSSIRARPSIREILARLLKHSDRKNPTWLICPWWIHQLVFLTQLLPYQRQGLAWMIKQESPSFPAQGSERIVQLWKRDSKGFVNVATNYSMSKEPPLASGGILADVYGLGKTIQVISLIMANAAPLNAGSSKSTLIIAPVGVMSNWRNQIQDHAKPEGAPSVLIYHGSGKKEAAKLASYDVVITSYGALAKEYKPTAKKPPTEGIFSLQWRRVVLDEGHTIRNPRSQSSLAACGLRADSRWSLTGTPIINTLKDLYSQVRFLRLSGGLEDLGMFKRCLESTLDPRRPLRLECFLRLSWGPSACVGERIWVSST